MQSASLVLLSGEQALQRAMDIVANNVANSSTSAFKREGISFDTLMSQSAPGEKLNFVVDRSTYRDTSVGPIETTGNQLDLAIQGSGYFPVQTPAGTRYTRGGSFQVNSQGQLVTQAGLPVLADGGQPISIPDTTTELDISGDGFVTARIDNGANLAQLGQIIVQGFDNEQAMVPEGRGLYSTDQTPKPSQDGSIIQGAIEQSNVQPILEMTSMIQVQRSYEQTANLISQENTRLSTAITTLSKTTA